MKTREEVLKFGLSFKNVYEELPVQRPKLAVGAREGK